MGRCRALLSVAQWERLSDSARTHMETKYDLVIVSNDLFQVGTIELWPPREDTNVKG